MSTSEACGKTRRIRSHSPERPDVSLFVSYSDSQEIVHVRIAPIETNEFRFGLELVPVFTGEDRWKKADEYALKVQKYLNDMMEYRNGRA